MTIRISGIDHLAITVADISRTVAFYRRVLGAREVTFGGGRKALQLGANKFDLHDAATGITPVSERPTPGAVDVCLLTETPMRDVIAHLSACDIPLVDGPVERTGALGPLLSVYFRDPDGNLIEVSNRA